MVKNKQVEESHTSSDIFPRVISIGYNSLISHCDLDTTPWTSQAFDDETKKVCEVGGLHVSVPTLVGETYAQRRLISKTSRKYSLIKEFEKLLREKRISPEGSERLTKIIEESMNSSQEETTTSLILLALEEIRDDHAVQEILNAAESARDNSALLSMDNETSWFVEVASRCEGRDRLFQAIRTTDYVRAMEDAAKISEDDLAKENAQKKEMLLKKISLMVSSHNITTNLFYVALLY